MTTVLASIIIPTRNGQPEIQACLESTFRQATPWSYEVLVIDSGSTDGTLDVVRQYPARVIEIPGETFNHGGTRNAAAEMAKGEFLVFLVQDAVPADDRWLAELVEAAQLPGAAGSYSRQLAHPGDHALTRLQMEQGLPQFEERLVQRLQPDQAWDTLSPMERFALATFRDSASCMRREVWKSYPFGTVPYGEDIDWGARVIQAGYAIVYEPRSAVYHSHDRSAWYELRRAYADHEMVMRLFGYNLFPKVRNVLASWARSSLAVARAVYRESPTFRQGTALVLRGFTTMGGRCWGAWLGARAVGKQNAGPFWRQLDAIMRNGV